MLKQPAGSSFSPSTGAFTWTTSAAVKGTDTAIFMVVDNGVPPMSDTETVLILVSDTISQPSAEMAIRYHRAERHGRQRA